MADAKKNNNMSFPPAVLIACGILLIVGAIAVGYLGMYSPALSDLDKVLKSKAMKMSELDDLQEQAVEFENYRKAKNTLDRRMEILKSKLPETEDELNMFLASINKRARSSKVNKWTLYKQESRVKKDGYFAVPIKMEFMATYDEAIQFFWDIASMGEDENDSSREPLVNIRNVQISRSSGGRNATVTELKVSCTAETYLYSASNGQNGSRR